MTSFMNAVKDDHARNNLTTTSNGMVAFQGSGDNIVELFYKAGASRNSVANAVRLFEKAFNEDKLLATKTMFWVRDVRGGAGERAVFRELIRKLEEIQPSIVVKNIRNIPKYGRWDDLLIFRVGGVAWTAAHELIKQTLLNQEDGFQLCAKWMPRKGPQAVALRNYMNLSPKAYRKLLVYSTNVVEQKMCAGEWEEIEYGKLPSLAAKQYQKAFNKHDPYGYSVYKDKLVSGAAKINAGAIFPHDVLVSLRKGDNVVAEAQWNALPDYLDGQRILPIADVSGSMTCKAGSGNTTCLDVSVALAMYTALKSKGAFEGLLLTFSSEPAFVNIKGNTLAAAYDKVQTAVWSMNTDLNKAMSKIVTLAANNNVPPEEMPTTLLIMSDMQFDNCAIYTADEMIKRRFEELGYEVPKIVFWNLNSHENTPTTFNSKGCALVSGFSPAILKSVLSAKTFTPLDIVMDTINSERYASVIV